MGDDKVSRRDFIRTTSMAAGTVAAGSASGAVEAAEEYTQSDYALRSKALVSVLTRKNLVSPDAMDAVVDFYETKVGPHIGARVVARLYGRGGIGSIKLEYIPAVFDLVTLADLN